MSTTRAAQRVIRSLVPKRSALRRRSDRLEVAARWVLLLVGLLVVPVALAVGSQVTADLTPQVAAQRADRHEVVGVVLAPPQRTDSSAPDVVAGDWRAPVRWTATDGTPRVALLRVPATTRVGDPRALWVDAGDRPTNAPLHADYPGAQGFLTALVILLGDLLLSLALLAGLRWVLDRARLRAWDEAWRRYAGPDHENLA